MKQHEDGKPEFCEISLSSSGTSLNTDFSSESTCNSYEISSLEREKIINKLRKDNEEYKYKMERGKKGYKKKVYVKNTKSYWIFIENRKRI